MRDWSKLKVVLKLTCAHSNPMYLLHYYHQTRQEKLVSRSLCRYQFMLITVASVKSAHVILTPRETAKRMFCTRYTHKFIATPLALPVRGTQMPPLVTSRPALTRVRMARISPWPVVPRNTVSAIRDHFWTDRRARYVQFVVYILTLTRFQVMAVRRTQPFTSVGFDGENTKWS